MKNPPDRPSATTLPSSPHDDASRRSRRYLVMMAIRILCFILMIVITPYGWYTWAFAAGAVFLPYIAVVFANNGDPSRDTVREAPEKAITASAPETPEARPTVIRVSETRPLDEAKAPPLVKGPTCSRAECRRDATWRIDWRNPKIHHAARRKTWIACDDHVDYLREFLAARSFPLEVAPLEVPA